MIYWRRWKFIGFFSCLSLMLSVSSLCCTLSAQSTNQTTNQSSNSGCEDNQVSISQARKSSILSSKQLHHRAEMISVKVMSQEVLGTGFLLKKQGCAYTVVTNAHVLRAGKAPFQIQTFDNRIWKAETKYVASAKGDDLAILQFRTRGEIYTVPSIGVNPVVGTKVVAAGFPFTEDDSGVDGFTLTTGKVSLVLDKALQGGYQIGYTNNIQKGMSGGALLNQNGQVVGVNGMHAFPLWDIPSVFESGEEADKTLHEKIVRLSWAVPMGKVERRMGGKGDGEMGRQGDKEKVIGNW
ncbi:MAG: serine protease [Cyanobacteriota bacterium]|nr:serine protease [Cyanobacteriota bacterium]